MEIVSGHTNERTDGWTDKHGSRNSYLDITNEYASPSGTDILPTL